MFTTLSYRSPHLKFVTIFQEAQGTDTNNTKMQKRGVPLPSGVTPNLRELDYIALVLATFTPGEKTTTLWGTQVFPVFSV